MDRRRSDPDMENRKGKRWHSAVVFDERYCLARVVGLNKDKKIEKQKVREADYRFDIAYFVHVCKVNTNGCAG
ncbi:hypothetical protein EYC80_008090 [Monilinia laxa]|uniref:Uncharacterized protein n=1 Tax=Monilinia laxa TaxID=61186 RepID=A0A5N6JVK4_MONLA|nr:hypothetical protein EYC80_008090 [Monilinia laxa]